MLLKFSGNYPNNSDEVELLAQARNAWFGLVASMGDFFRSYRWKEIIFTLKVISFIFSVLMLAAILYLFFKTIITNRAAQKSKRNNKRWLKIEKKLNSGQEANYKLAILEADAFYDDHLKMLGYEKEKKLSNIDDIKLAKKIKVKIVDDADFRPTKEQAEKSVFAYKKGLEELGVL